MATSNARRTSRRLLTGSLIALAASAWAGTDNRFCGGAVAQGSPDDLANVVGDQTLEYAVTQPAGIVTCSKGYLLEKCGDHASANIVFDRCIAAGYVGAMVWKALMIEDGNGNEGEGPGQAAALMQRAATSGDPAYAPLGMLHYATMLYQGKGVARDEVEAMKWFQAAAAAGSEEAKTFLATGYHTGDRDLQSLGAGRPTAEALAAGGLEHPSGVAPVPVALVSPAKGHGSAAAFAMRRLGGADATPPLASPAPMAPDALLTPPTEIVAGRHLEKVSPSVPAGSRQGWLIGLLLLITAFASGLVRSTPAVSRPRLSLSFARSTP
jgi:hypothetical protein